jgi:hypothetical protein
MKNVIVLRDNQDDEMHNIDLICIGDITEEGLKQVIKSMYDEIDEFEERGETWDNSMVEWIEEHLPENVKAYRMTGQVWY